MTWLQLERRKTEKETVDEGMMGGNDSVGEKLNRK